MNIHHHLQERLRTNSMHEYPITCEIIRIAEEHGIKNNASKIKKVVLVVGEYSGFVGDSIEMYFNEISKGTLCEGAEITIEHITPKLRCTKCGQLFEREFLSFNCTLCGGIGEPTEIGKEFYVDYIEIG